MSGEYHIEDETHQKSYDSSLMRRLLAFVRPYRLWMGLAVFLLLLASVLVNLTPYLFKVTLDRYVGNVERINLQERISGGENGLGDTLLELVQADKGGLATLVAWIALLMIGEAIARILQMFLVSIVGQKTMLEMRMQVFAHLQKMSLRFLDRNPIGRLMTRVTNDVEKIQQTIVSGMVQVISDLLTIVVVLAFMFVVDWRLALIALSPVPFVFLTSLLFRKYARRTFLEIRRRIARLNAYMQEAVTGMHVIQVFGAEPQVFDEYDSRNKEHRDEWFRQVKYHAIYFPLVEFFGALSVALVIFYVGGKFLSSSLTTGAAIGTLFAYVQWSERLFTPIRALADRYNLLLEAMASSERVFELLDTPEDIADNTDATQCTSLRGEVVLDDVWFGYEPHTWVLKGISLSIAPGERVAIVGHTGAGKTTLINDLSDEQIRTCAAYVNAAQFIDRLPEGYGYDVGERGKNLSTGQRQLLAFARTLAHDPQILVLDEATSSVDTETEALIQDAIHKLMEGRTAILIAHRLSTVQSADRIIVMHHGEIREQGTHQELLAQRGLYHRLYELQYNDQLR